MRIYRISIFLFVANSFYAFTHFEQTEVNKSKQHQTSARSKSEKSTSENVHIARKRSPRKEYFAGQESQPGENGFAHQEAGFVGCSNAAPNGKTAQLTIGIGSNVNIAAHRFSEAKVGRHILQQHRRIHQFVEATRPDASGQYSVPQRYQSLFQQFECYILDKPHHGPNNIPGQNQSHKRIDGRIKSSIHWEHVEQQHFDNAKVARQPPVIELQFI